MMAGMRRDLECMIAIKEMKVPYTKTQYSFSTHLMRPPKGDPLLPSNSHCRPKKC